MGRFRFSLSRIEQRPRQLAVFKGFPNLRQALFQAGSESALTAKSIFAGLRRSLECTPQRRCGGMVDATDLKSVLAKAGYGFESHHRHPRKPNLARYNSLGYNFVGYEWSRTKTHKNTVYSSSI